MFIAPMVLGFPKLRRSDMHFAPAELKFKMPVGNYKHLVPHGTTRLKANITSKLDPAKIYHPAESTQQSKAAGSHS